MRTSFSSGAFGVYPLTEVIPRLADLGYQGVELNAVTYPWAKPPHVSGRLGIKRRAAIRQLARDYGVELPAISAHTSLVDADQRTRQRRVDFVKGCIDLAPDVGTDLVIIMAGPPPAGIDREQAWGWLLENLATCTRHAAERGVRLALEAVVGMMVASVGDLKRVLADLGEQNLYVNFDPGHLVLAGDDPASAVKTLAAHIMYVHVKDARRRLPGEEKAMLLGTPVDFEFPPLGKGVVRFREMVGALREIGYQGFISVEYERMAFGYEEDLWEMAARTKLFLDDLLSH